MIKHIILLSGHISSGKSTLADKLVGFYGGHLFKTNEILKKLDFKKHRLAERRNLQNLGQRLDNKSDGQWVQIKLLDFINNLENINELSEIIVVDSVRIEKQIDWIRKAFGNIVVHIHLTAEKSELSKRYLKRKNKISELKRFDEVLKNRTEKNVAKLSSKADVVISTDRCTPEDVFVRTCTQLKLDHHTVVPLVDVIIGGQYGSEGKGNVAAYIAPEYKVLVRVGGPNAGHKVYGEPIRTFRHLPSGTEQAPNAIIILGPGAVINPEVLFKEIAMVGGINHKRLSIDPNAMIIRQSDIENEKQHLTASISSTGQGVGAATARKITDRGKKADPVKTAKDIDELKPFVRPTGPILQRAYSQLDPILLEGTQGTTLSLHHGPYPYVTSRDTTVTGCLAEAGIAPRRVRKVILVCRTYPIRVGGNSGPMSKKISYQELSRRSGIPISELKQAEKTSTTNKQRRISEFDWAQLRQSVILNAPTDIALTFADYLDVKNREARRFEQLTEGTIRFIEEIQKLAKAPVSLISTRFHYRSVIDRRSW